MANSNLKNKTIAGISWSAVDSIASRGITFIVGIVLARLLTPSEYGLIGMITIFISVSNTIVDSGFSNALIRKKDVTEEDYSTAFVFNLLLSILVYVILYIGSPLIANFFHQGQLTILTRVLCVVVIINSIAIVQRTKLVRNIDFKRQAKISISASTISGVVGISLAIFGFGVWSLVAQQITRQSVLALGLWISAHWTPTIMFSKQSFMYQFNFGWKLLCSQLISTIWHEASNMVVGRCYTSSTLGQYSRAFQFSGFFSTNLTTIIQNVSFPVLSSIQDEQERMKANYKRMLKDSMFISFIGMLALAACSKPLVFVLIGEKWAEAASYLPLLCFNFMLFPARAINTNMLQVVGRSDQLLKLEIIKKTLAVIPLLLGVFIGIYWMLWGNVINGFIGYLLNSYFSGKYIKYTTKQQIIDIMPSFAFGTLVSICMYLITFLHFNSIVTLSFQISIGAILVITLGELLKQESYRELKEIALSFLSKIQRK